MQFYGALISQAYINSNGSLQLTGNMTRFGTSCPLPDRCLDAAILVYQDDLRTDGPGDGVFTSVSGNAPNRVFNIEWRTRLIFGRPGSANFEVRFYENQTSFEMVYGVSNENGALASSGVQQRSPWRSIRRPAHNVLVRHAHAHKRVESHLPFRALHDATSPYAAPASVVGFSNFIPPEQHGRDAALRLSGRRSAPSLPID